MILPAEFSTCVNITCIMKYFLIFCNISAFFKGGFFFTDWSQCFMKHYYSEIPDDNISKECGTKEVMRMHRKFYSETLKKEIISEI